MGAVIAVGKAREWVPELIERARVLKVGSGFSAGTDV
jgi:malonate-semialdehyde dehydrogenase (acetylating)/methylmalonate-semialdehyde dehydrogenase